MRNDLIGAVREPASTLQLLTLAREHGLTDSDCLTGSAIKLSDLHQPGYLLPAEQELIVIANLKQHLPHYASLALEAGLRMQFTEYGLFGMAMMASTTTTLLLKTAVRFSELSWIYCQLAVEETTEELLLLADDSHLPLPLRDFLFLRDLGSLFALGKTLLPANRHLGRVELKMHFHSDLKPYLSLLGEDVKFSQRRNLFAINKSTALSELPLGNFNAYQRWEKECSKLLLERKKRQGLAGRIRRQLRDNSFAKANMVNISEDLKIHPRKLRRQLKTENQTLKGLIDEYRRSRAESLLINSDLAITGIAEQLGYSEASCFSRAFKRWHRQSPLQYRTTKR
ncbi:MAG: hypothetical protein COC19_02315 [SAR86 cluster bacterium]|uniref:HTH araC/xylS-type domain-containing protein n=1 Tax=SAR86 cluster bacterium TaxID=2030880 RepID=A0A2A4MT51_9GAMM|nr:MAG: hypothetical protein COC19_02315 [SAR86 cluster bacterium]